MEKLKIGDRFIGENHSTFIIGELSANHNKNYNTAVESIKEMKRCGVDAVKIQTYRADTITIDCDNDYFKIKQDTVWDGQTLFNLYKKAYTPWEWQPKLKKIAEDLGLIFFSSPFDFSAVDFLENLNVPIYKIASFEITDIPLIKYIASKGKPVIMSTGIATLTDIEEAINACKSVGNDQIIILKCTSSYPAPVNDINLKTIPNIKETFNVLAGLSDHTLGSAVSIAAVALGANVIEKHFILDKKIGGPDSAFSMIPEEFKLMVNAIRDIEKSLGSVNYSLNARTLKNREFSRSLFVVKDIKNGELFTKENIKSIRPSFGLLPKYYDSILGKRAKSDLKKGTPLAWKFIDI